MHMKVKVFDRVQTSKVNQIVVAIATNIERGTLKEGYKLPSINEFSEKNRVARDTIEKAYKQLRMQGYIASYPSRGYFVLGRSAKQLRVLLLFNKLSSFKKIVYDEMLLAFGEQAKVELQIHHYNPKLLQEILNDRLGKYDYYVIMPHFFSDADPDECLQIIRMVPPHQLVVLDKPVTGLTDSCKAIVQDFYWDSYNALYTLSNKIKKYNGVTLILPETIHHPKEIVDGIKAFCKAAKKKFYLQPVVQKLQLQKAMVYITADDDDLAALIKKSRQSAFRPGTDMGIISFNETVFKELLDITVITTDFPAMGRTAAELMLSKEVVQLNNPFRVIQRGSI